jgi:hypothetical protein
VSPRDARLLRRAPRAAAGKAADDDESAAGRGTGTPSRAARGARQGAASSRRGAADAT